MWMLLAVLPWFAHDPAPAAQTPDATTPRVRFFTNRSSNVRFPLPDEQEAFFFAIFGDRTGGPAEGVEVLAEAVQEVNLLEPDLVMTVGDLIQGYNESAEWLIQMDEYKGIMNELVCPWFPVAGNHDTYWRGPEGQRPSSEHDRDYETHFGPLWYAFSHKGSWFIVLYSDEGDDQGRKAFDRPEAQRMSPEQFAWLDATLQRASGADHVFVFLHHPRWIAGRYGNDWEKVHARLARAGNVSAVFAGHIHQMRYDGPRDGIEYFTLATVGGHQSGAVPQAGHLHQYHLVVVRPDHVAVAAYPVGSGFDPRNITGEISLEARALSQNLAPQWAGAVPLRADLSANANLAFTVANPTTSPIEMTASPTTSDGRWHVQPDHLHARLEPGESRRFELSVARDPSVLDSAFELLSLDLGADYLAETMRIEVPQRAFEVPLGLEQLVAPEAPDTESVLSLGEGSYARVPSASLDLPDGPFTVEGWLNARSLQDRQAFLSKTERGEFGLFVSKGIPTFAVHLGTGYVTAEAPEPLLSAGVWHHLAGVYDGSELRLYLDGRLVSSVRGSGPRTRHELPLVVGGEVTGRGEAEMTFDGEVDEIRISRGAAYSSESFTPTRRMDADDNTALLLHMDADLGPWLYDSSGSGAHAIRENGATCRPIRKAAESPPPANR